MKRKLLHLLVCPADDCFPLELYVFEETDEVNAGVLFCSRCLRWYPIKKKTPELLHDKSRVQSADLAFLCAWKRFLPQKIVTTGKPFNLNSATENHLKKKRKRKMKRVKESALVVELI
ncbi:MAG: Trm112 family protein [Candidatus Bathyarchaeota archaeon]|nr:Trm112 family protein [Candidatus Bathyarchaeota archaeon]